jgi:glycosyltransferase involved in cell wall biosynthesis
VYENTLQPDAFVLVIDGPIPPALQLAIQSLQEQFAIDTLQLPINMGLALALNAGLKKVRTRWVVRADADDYNLPNRFALQATAISLSGESLDIIGGAIQEVDVDGTPLAVRRTPESHAEILRYSAIRNPFNHMTVAYRTEFALKCGAYPNIHLKEDYALWAQMLCSGAHARNLPEILVFATAHKGIYHRRGGWRYAHAEISLQEHLAQVGLKSPMSALIDGLSRAGIFLLPVAVRGMFYKLALRSNVKKPNAAAFHPFFQRSL